MALLGNAWALSMLGFFATIGFFSFLLRGINFVGRSLCDFAAARRWVYQFKLPGMPPEITPSHQVWFPNPDRPGSNMYVAGGRKAYERILAKRKTARKI